MSRRRGKNWIRAQSHPNLIVRFRHHVKCVRRRSQPDSFCSRSSPNQRPPVCDCYQPLSAIHLASQAVRPGQVDGEIFMIVGGGTRGTTLFPLCRP
ncbi:hypothetical protein BGY98DRAFT_95057 [Russula aff. rugulosa BPL654]|nr:hypothetical protein BGY98DRAFT_95057 [Russula aff. rugulosa BPL654]